MISISKADLLVSLAGGIFIGGARNDTSYSSRIFCCNNTYERSWFKHKGFIGNYLHWVRSALCKLRDNLLVDT